MSTKTLPATSPESLRDKPTLRIHAGRRDVAAAAGFLAPFIILLLVFQYIPLAVLGRDSLFDYTLLNPDAKTFVGVDNFVFALTDTRVLQSLLVTFGFMAGFVIITLPLAFLLAVYLNSRLPARAIIRTMVFLPVITSSVVVATMFGFMLSKSGLVNSFLEGFGIGPFPFLTSSALALPSIIVMTVWHQVGLAAILFLGGLQSIPEEVNEAATVDGAGPFRRAISITIPLVLRTTLLVVVVTTVFGLQAFAPAYLMTSGGPSGSTNLIIYQIYQTAFFLQQPGVASAVSIIVLVFAMVVSLIQLRLLRTRWSY